MQRRPRVIDQAHQKFIRCLPCLVCGDNTSTECCHIRFSDARIGKINPGVGQKPHDKFSAPLCNRHHREQHMGNEQKFWQDRGIDPILIALALYSVSGDVEEAEHIIRSIHEHACTDPKISNVNTK